MAKDKSGKSSDIKAGVLNLTDEELDQAEKRKDWIGGGGALPEIGEHDGVISLFEPTEISTTEKTKGAQKFRVEVTLDNGGARLNDFLIAHPSTAGRLIKVLEITELKRVERRPDGSNGLKLPNADECAAKIGTRVRVTVTGFQDQYRDRDKPADERRQQAVWGFVSALGGKAKSSSSSNGAAKASKGEKAKAGIAR